tara:strand:+ start:231 stop:1025 length:795 start_codon:yes stop_codon:yes gene_type:complete
MKNFYVIGNNTSKSLSPLIFNYWFKKNKINAKYLFKQIQTRNFEKEIKIILAQKNTFGINITIPFKEKIIPFLFSSDKHSKKIGAVNCITKSNKGWVGKNTDWIGFGKSLKQNNNKINKKKALIIGYGGASKAIIYFLIKENYKKVMVFNRSKKNTDYLKKETSLQIKDLNDLAKNIKNADIIINTTPINVFNTSLKTRIQKKTTGYDVVYKPKETDFLKNFNEDKRAHGIYMLLYQAAPCFKEWFGFTPKIDKELIDIIEKKI